MVVNVVVQDGQSITGLIQEGSNVTITGNGTATDPYVISASGGGGGSGDRGWSPLIRSVSDGERRVQEVYDWTGGQGVKPTITGYIGATGIVQDISLATDIRGDKGQDGAPGIQGEKGDKGDPGNDGEQGAPGASGADGASAYEVAVENGFVGSEAEWLDSLQGVPGPAGQDGQDGSQGAKGDPGEDGKSAYQIWLDEGNTGSEQDFIDSLKGERGEQGIQGLPGADGADGEQGPKGDKGDPGTTDYNELDNKPTLGTAASANTTDFATAAQGALADTAVQSAQEGGVGILVSNMIQVTQAQYDGLTPQAGTFYVIVG